MGFRFSPLSTLVFQRDGKSHSSHIPLCKCLSFHLTQEHDTFYPHASGSYRSQHSPATGLLSQPGRGIPGSSWLVLLVHLEDECIPEAVSLSLKPQMESIRDMPAFTGNITFFTHPLTFFFNFYLCCIVDYPVKA